MTTAYARGAMDHDPYHAHMLEMPGDDAAQLSVEERARARLRIEGLEVMAWGNGPGDRYAAHQHAHDKVLVVVAGHIDFLLPGRGERIGLRSGDRLELPAGTVHAAVVGADGVRCLEAHLPAGSVGTMPGRVADWVGGGTRRVPGTGVGRPRTGTGTET